MQQFLTRKEIRRQVRASLGQTTDEGLATMNREAIDVSIEKACLQAHADMRPLKAQVEDTFDLGIQQSEVEYPEDAGPGSLVEAAIYDDVGKVYLPLRRKRRRADNSDDQALAEGGEAMAAVVDIPRWIADEKNGWRVFPTTDKAYKLRVRYQIRQVFNTDEELSTVDAQLIISYALYLETRTSDAQSSEAHIGDYRSRRGLLKGFEQAGTAISYDKDADFDDDCDPDADPPRWDTRPARQG